MHKENAGRKGTVGRKGRKTCKKEKQQRKTEKLCKKKVQHGQTGRKVRGKKELKIERKAVRAIGK